MLDVRRELSSEAQQFMHALSAEGWTDREVEEVARQHHLSEAEIDEWAARDSSNAEAHLKAETNIAIIAAKMNACLLNRGKPNTPAILNLNNEQLLSAIDYYYGSLTSIYAEIIAAEAQGRWDNPGWCKLMGDFTRQAGFLWEAEQRAGLPKLNEATLVGAA